MVPEDGGGESGSPGESESPEVPIAKLERLAGDYWSDKEREFQKVILEDGVLYLNPVSDYKFELVSQSSTQYAVTTPWEVVDLTFEDTSDTGVEMILLVRGEDKPRAYERFEPRRLTGSELQDYTGTFFSEELNVEYILADQDGTLTFEINRRGEHPLAAKFGETFHNPDYGIFTFQRGADDKVTGFLLDAGRVTNLEFVRR